MRRWVFHRAERLFWRWALYAYDLSRTFFGWSSWAGKHLHDDP